MEKIQIIGTTDLVTGGCNVCPTVLNTTYHLTINGIDRLLGDLDVSSLVMTVALAKGFQLSQEYDVMEDYDIYRHGTLEISVFERQAKRVFKRGLEQKEVMNQPKDQLEVLSITSAILAEYFDLEGIVFELAE